MCNYGCSSVKHLSQRVLQDMANPIKTLLYESKDKQRL
jgi:hypothetical protein